MILTYVYKLQPSSEQAATLDHWLELLRRHWHYALGERLDWLNATRCPIDPCSLHRCPIGDIPAKVDYSTQQSALKETKRLFPEYKQIWAETQQVNLQRLKKAWERWLIPDASGKRGGRPRFKQSGDLRSFVFPRTNNKRAGAHLHGGILKLSRIGEIPVIMHRPIPDGFILKQTTIIKKADGWYCCIGLEDKSIPLSVPVEIKQAVGIDVGLEKFLVASEGEAIEIPQFFRKSERRLARRQRQLARAQKGSRNWKRLKNQIARLWLKFKRQRTDFFYRVAHWLCERYDLIAFEDLNIRGLARTRLAKSILEAAWGEFLKILQAVAVKCSKQAVGGDARRTSIECSDCGAEVRKTIAVRVHHCPECGLVIDRDWNAAINILKRVMGDLDIAPLAVDGYRDAGPVKQQIPVVRLGSPRYSAISA